MPKRDFFILLFITLFIWNSGYEVGNTHFFADGNYWFIGFSTFIILWLMWQLNKKIFQLLEKKMPINLQKLRTLFPYFLVAFLVSLVIYIGGFNLVFSIPPPFENDSAFELRPPSILFTAFILASFFLWSKVKNELAKKPTEIIRETIIEKTETPKKKIQLRRGNSTFQIPIEDIAYFSLNNSMVYLTKTDGTSFSILDSLAQIKNQSENGTLFAANRQFLISKKAVKSWKRTETRKLALELSPSASELVTVSKNRAPEFIQWMEK